LSAASYRTNPPPSEINPDVTQERAAATRRTSFGPRSAPPLADLSGSNSGKL